MKFLQLDRMLNPNVCYSFVVMATNSDVSSKNAFSGLFQAVLLT